MRTFGSDVIVLHFVPQLYKIELEREQLQHTIESTKNGHSEEIESIQKSNEYVRDCVGMGLCL